VRQRLPFVLSATALIVAVFGSTPLGEAAGRLVRAVPPFAKKAGYANRAGQANFARIAANANNAKLLAGHRASAAGAAGVIPLTGSDGKLATSFGTVGPAGPAGPPGDTSKLLGRTVTVTASRAITTGFHYDFVLCPSGYEAVGGGAYQDNYRAVGSATPPIFLLASGPTNSTGSFLADGPGGPPAGWGALIVRSAGPADTIHWSAVCAKEGP
jgi:hypothetical protein